jgi:hypothetical protein
MATTTPQDSRNVEDENNPAQKTYEQKLGNQEYGAPSTDYLKQREGLENPDQKDNQPAGNTTESVSDTPVSSQERSFYRNPGAKRPGANKKLLDSKNRNRYLIYGGLGAGLIGALITLFFFLGAFKLEGLMANIEERAFLRNNATLDTRSTKLMSAYIRARLLDIGDHPNFSNPDFVKDDNLLFRASRVDTNNPFFDWYRTLRTSKFEQTVFESKGIKFTSVVTPDGKFRPGLIDINGEKPIPFTVADISSSDFKKLSVGDIATIQKFGKIVDTKVFDNNKQGRLAIKKVVKDNTQWWQVFKRRSLRKDIQNMTGVKSWRFFETTRDKISDKKIDLRNRFINNMLPDDTLIQNIARCFYGLSECASSRDEADKRIQAQSEDIIKEPAPAENDTTAVRNETELSKEAPSLDAAGISDALKKILVAADIFNRLLNIPFTLDMLASVDKGISHVAKLVVVARGMQAAGLFQEFETARDQNRVGAVNSKELNALMLNLDTATASQGWTSVVDGKGDPGKTYTTGQCSQEAQALQEKDPQQYQKKYGVYAPLCQDQQIGSAANAQKIQDDYKATIGTVVHPIVLSWEALKSTPILGHLIGLLEWFGNLVNKIIDPVVSAVLNALGLKDNLQAAIAWVFAKTSNFLGLTIIKGYESAGTITNWLIQGGSYTAESASRQEGAALTTPASKIAALNSVSQFDSDKQSNATLYDRVASLDNPDSLAFRGATAISQLQSNPTASIFTGLAGMWSSAVKNFGSIFSGHIYAATPNGYAASQFADIETYDFPQQCYDMDPITATPMGGTNVLDIFNKYGLQPSSAQMAALQSWDTETNSKAFFDTVYSIILPKYPDNADDIAVQIYNCNLLDTVTRGSLGYIFGYTKDNADLVQ